MTTMTSSPEGGRPSSEGGRHTTQLDESGKAVVHDEEAMSQKVAQSVANSVAGVGPGQPGGPDARSELLSLRDQVAEARLEDVPALVTEMMRVAAVAQVDTPDAAGPVDARSPYFGHLRLEETLPSRPGRRARQVTRDVLIGKRGLVDREAGVTIVDWRNAPVSRLYYRYEQDDDYEETFGDELREGRVAVRRTVSFDDGRLVRIRTPDTTYIRRGAEGDEGEGWVDVGQGRTHELTGGAGVAARAPALKPKPQRARRGKRRGRGRGRDRDRPLLGHEGPSHLRPDKHLPEIAALIDPSQFEAMTRPDAGIVVLQGGAGSGKTTVALHRIAWLAYQDPQRFRPSRMLVTVKQPALVKYTERVLPSLDVPDVKVQSYRGFCDAALRYILPGPKQKDLVEDAPTDVARVKKHPGMLKALKKQVARRLDETRAGLVERTAGREGHDLVLAAFDERERTSAPLLAQLGDVVRGIDASRAPEDTKERARRAVIAVRDRARDVLGEWEELITDPVLLAPVTEGEAPIELPALRAALTWTGQQVEEPEDDGYDPEAKRPVDDGSDDEGPTCSLDPYDLPLLLNLWIERTGGLHNPRSGKALEYDHVAVDEAQDLSAVEIRPLMVATGENRSLTLAGDVVQKVVFDNGFEDWDQLLGQLDVEATLVEPFRLSYRSTAEVTELAQQVLGPLAPEQPPRAVRSGAPVEAFAFTEPGEEIAFLADNLRAVMNREPNASVAVLTRYPERAAFFHRMLKEAEVPHLRLVERGDFPFTPGVDVTHIQQVKGLEYDYVVLAEVTEPMYPAEDAARHLLHIAATRAAHQLWITTQTGAPSPLLPPSLIVD